MDSIYSISKKIIYFIRSRIQLIFFLISLFSIVFIYLKLINIEMITWISANPVLIFLIQLVIKSSAIFVILFLPTYPIFFILFQKKNLHFREKLGISIVSNLSYYIIIGYIGSCFNIPITFGYFFFILVFTYVSILLIGIFLGYHQGTGLLFKKAYNFDYKPLNDEKSSFPIFINKYISLNGILLIVFIVLICIFYIVNTSIFAGTDVWFHISIVRYITEVNYIPMNEYHGTLGLHIFGTVIHFFSGLDLILIPKYYMFYTIPLSSLILYNLLMRIFKNKDLAIFGVFLLISSMGFSWFMMVQFWPSGIALIQGLVIFFILYVRLQSFTKEEVPKKEVLFSNIFFLYILLTFLFISAFLTHSLVTMILLISYLWLYLIYFVKNFKRGFDFLLLIFFFCIFLIFYALNISSELFQVYSLYNIIPWYYLLIGALGLLFVITLILLHYRKSMDFTKGIFRLIIEGKKKQIYKKIEDKYIFPLIFSLTIVLSVIFTFFNLTFFNINISYIFYFIDMLIISLFSIWGYAIFQYKPRGKPLFIWGIALDFLLLALFIFDGIIGITTFFLRVFYITSIIILIGFVSYLYIIIKNNLFQKRKFKIFLLFMVVFSLFTSYLYDSTSIDIFCLREREVNSIQWYSNYTSNKEVIISKFGWHAIFIYYDYPFEDKNKELPLESIHYFLLVDSQLIHPDLHISNGSNILKNIKSDYNTDVILVFPEEYYSPFSWTFFDQLSEEEIEAYYNLDYLNRIFSAKGENGEDIPYYWVI